MRKRIVEALAANPRAAVLLSGIVLVVAGLAVIYWPAALVAAGAVLIADSYRRSG